MTTAELNWKAAYWEGYKAYQRFIARLDNPYNKGTDEYEAWIDGWNRAGYEATVDG